MITWLAIFFKLTTATTRRFQQKNAPPVGSSEIEIQLKRDQQRQSMLDRVFESEEKCALKRAYRQQETIRREQEIEDSLRRAETDRIAKQQALQQEERLANELERYKLEQLRDVKMRQQLRETR